MLRVLLAAVVAALLVVPSAVAATPGVMEQESFSNGAGTRTYFVYEPVAGGAGKPVMVWLHGCGGPGTMSAGHALARVAEERGFTVVYPVQPSSANGLRCWNWPSAGHQKRGIGEPSILAGITSSVLTEVAGDPARVYVGGYSAGGAMTTVMGATYPDLLRRDRTVGRRAVRDLRRLGHPGLPRDGPPRAAGAGVHPAGAA